MTLIQLPTDQITDFESFHTICKQIFGFPDFYGRNMDAWIDCLTYLDEDDGMSQVAVELGGRLEIEVMDTIVFTERVPDVFQAFVECTAYVNIRHIEAGKQPMLELVFM
jgi:hypothetical protein